MTFEENASDVLTMPPSEQDEMLPADPTAAAPHEAFEPELWQEIDDHHYDEIRRMQAETDPWLIISSL